MQTYVIQRRHPRSVDASLTAQVGPSLVAIAFAALLVWAVVAMSHLGPIADRAIDRTAPMPAPVAVPAPAPAPAPFTISQG